MVGWVHDGDSNLERDSEGVTGLGVGEMVSLILNFPRDVNQKQLGEREAGVRTHRGSWEPQARLSPCRKKAK